MSSQMDPCRLYLYPARCHSPSLVYCVHRGQYNWREGIFSISILADRTFYVITLRHMRNVSTFILSSKVTPELMHKIWPPLPSWCSSVTCWMFQTHTLSKRPNRASGLVTRLYESTINHLEGRVEDIHQISFFSASLRFQFFLGELPVSIFLPGDLSDDSWSTPYHQKHHNIAWIIVAMTSPFISTLDSVCLYL